MVEKEKVNDTITRYQAEEGELGQKLGTVPNTEMTPETFYVIGFASAKPKFGKCNLPCSQKLEKIFQCLQ